MAEWRDWQDMTEADKFKIIFNTLVKRSGKNGLLSWLGAAGFFEAPAGQKHHGAFPGGLVAHSNNVYRRLVMIYAEESRKNPAIHERYSDEAIAVVALLHDVCKVDVYKQDEDGSYSYNDPLPLGHGEKSVYLITQFMTLTPDEALAIRWHMGAFDKAAQSDFRDLDKTQKQCKLAVMLHIADMMATHFDEAEV